MREIGLDTPFWRHPGFLSPFDCGRLERGEIEICPQDQLCHVLVEGGARKAQYRRATGLVTMPLDSPRQGFGDSIDATHCQVQASTTQICAIFDGLPQGRSRWDDESRPVDGSFFAHIAVSRIHDL